MKRKSRAMSVATGCILTFLILAGCGSPDNRRGKDAFVHGDADIRGYITDISTTESDEGGMLGTILIEGEPEEDTGFDKASVRVTRDTRILTETDGETSETTFSDLRMGQYVQAAFTGPVAESYPVQATAAEIVVLGSTPIGEVKDQHEEELLSIKGVVGVGISSRDGEPVIVVYLE